MALDKERFAQACQQTATLLARCVNEARDQAVAYAQRFYGSGGADEILLADLANVPGLTPAELNLWITLCNQLQNFNNNTAVTTANYGATIAVMRNDI